MHPLAAGGLYSGMAGGHFPFCISNEAVVIGCHVVLRVPFTAFSQLDMRTIGIGRPKIRDINATSLSIRMILNKEKGTGRRGLVTPMPACSNLLLLCVLEDQLRVTVEGVGYCLLSLLS